MSCSNSASSDRKELSTTQEGLRLLQALQTVLVQHNEQLEVLKTRVQGLENERDELKRRLETETNRNSVKLTDDKQCQTNPEEFDAANNLDSVFQDVVDGKETNKSISAETETQEIEITILNDRFPETGDCPDGLVEAQKARTRSFDSQKKQDSQEVMLNPIPEGKGVMSTPHKGSRRGTTHIKRQNSKGRVDMYQLSPDLQAVTVDLLANKYGGKEKANNAARIIQEYYRHWVLSKSFKRMRAYSEKRKKSITKYPEKLLDAERSKTHWRGPVHKIEQPVLIVDLDGNDSNNDTSYMQIKEEKEDKEADAERNERSTSFLRTMSRGKIVDDERGAANGDAKKKIVLPSDSVFYCGSPDGKVERETLLGSSNFDKSVEGTEESVVSDEKLNHEEGNTSSQCKKKIGRCESTDSYEIIDEQQLLQVIGRVNDEQSAETGSSSVSSDNIDDIAGSHDQSSSIFYDDDHYPPTVDKSRKWRYKIGINLFNSKPEDGIEYLVDNGLLESTPKAIAEFLRKETSISKQKISEYLGSLRKEMNRNALSEFAQSFDFCGKDIDDALRQFQSYFKLTGEAQSIERFLQVFSERYVACNPNGISTNVDTILLLSYAMAMLNTDLHNENVKRKMTMADFVSNLRGTDDGKDFPAEMLHNIFNRIQKNEFSTGADHMTQLKQIEQSFIGKVPSIAVPHRQFVKLYTLEEVYDPNRHDKPHFRLAFLFNDLLLLAKPRSKQGGHGSGHIFSYKASFSLLGMQVAEFSNEHYKFGVYLQVKSDSKTVGRFNLRDEKMRKSFTEELDDCIRETTGMNNIRIALSKSKQISRNNYVGPQSMTLDRKKMKKKRAVGGETISLLSVDMNSLEAESLSKSRASSMLDISETASDTESEPMMRRSTSSTSLDNSSLSASSKHSSLPRSNEGKRSPSANFRKGSFFGFSRRRKASVERASSSTGALERRKEVGMLTFFQEIEDLTENNV